MSAEPDALMKALQEEVKTLTEALQAKDVEAKSATERSLRAMADLANFQRRTEEDQRDFREYAVADFMKKLLPILDHFQQALKSIEGDAGVSESHKKGIQLIWKELMKVMETEGLTVQETVGQVFNPNFHEVVGVVVEGPGKEGHILEDMRRGYELKGRVLRPAMVKIKAPAASPVSADADAHAPEREASEQESHGG